jgi:hypothetical protein
VNRVAYFFVFVTFLFAVQVSAQTFPRVAEIQDPAGLEEGGFGGVIAGVDFDKDGLPEIYACNTNMVDRENELIPKIYKFEWNAVAATWDSVWGAVAPLANQNTWPAFTWGDLDKDGKPEIYWAPVNYDPYPELPRILVYEYPGDGTDNMGVDDGFGGFEPNAKTSIVPGDGQNIRPVRFVIADVDNDGVNELIFADRQSSTSNFHVGVLSVDDIPDNGGGLETWTEEFSGVGDAYLSGTRTKWDLSVINNYIYLYDIPNTAGTGVGKVYPIRFQNGNWESLPPQSGIMGDNGSFKGSITTDIDGDGEDEIMVAEWWGGKIHLLKQVSDTLQSFTITDFAPLAVRLNSAAVGDIDNDGKVDFVFGSRYMAANTAKVPVFRLEYQGGDITTPSNYIASVLDSAYWDKNGEMEVYVGNIDGDPADEVLYTQGYSRGNNNDDKMPLIVLDPQVTPVSVERENDMVPAQFYLDQNFPNPFNPSTEIKFGITDAANVSLRIYDALGREVAVLINNEFKSAGSYNIKFDASKLASGNYVYRMTAGANTVSRKMQLLK